MRCVEPLFMIKIIADKLYIFNLVLTFLMGNLCFLGTQNSKCMEGRELTQHLCHVS